MAARSNCGTIVHLANFIKTIFLRLKTDVFGLDVSVGCGGICAGLHPARKRSNGGLGALEDSPQLNNNGLHVRGDFLLRSRCECEANPAGKSPERATGRQSPDFSSGAVAEPAGEPNNWAAAGLAALLPVGDWTGVADREEERGRRKA